MAGARGCFNCGGCAWCFRVVVVVSPSRASCTDAACTYLSPISSRPPHSNSPLSFSFLVVRGAVLTGTAFSFFFIHCIHIDPAQSKFIVQKKKMHRRDAHVDRCQLGTRPQIALRLAHLLGKHLSLLRLDDFPIA